MSADTLRILRERDDAIAELKRAKTKIAALELVAQRFERFSKEESVKAEKPGTSNGYSDKHLARHLTWGHAAAQVNQVLRSDFEAEQTVKDEAETLANVRQSHAASLEETIAEVTAERDRFKAELWELQRNAPQEDDGTKVDPKLTVPQAIMLVAAAKAMLDGDEAHAARIGVSFKVLERAAYKLTNIIERHTDTASDSGTFRRPLPPGDTEPELPRVRSAEVRAATAAIEHQPVPTPRAS